MIWRPHFESAPNVKSFKHLGHLDMRPFPSSLGVVLEPTSSASMPGSLGFRSGATSVHTSRTMMLEELALVLDREPPNARIDGYREAIIEQNLLGKPTRTTRMRTAKRLEELYALDPSCPIFQGLRRYWTVDPASRPMLAYLTAAARDPLLREMTPFVLGVPVGEIVGPEPIGAYMKDKYPQRFGPSTALATAQRLASTWTQSGFLQGKVQKKRTRPRVTPVVLTYAVFLGLLCGLKGKLLLQSPWTDLLDRSPAELQDLAFEASSQGWMNYRAAGEVVEITIPEASRIECEG